MTRVAAGLSSTTLRRPLMTTSGAAIAANIGIRTAVRAINRRLDLMQRIISQALLLAVSKLSRRAPSFGPTPLERPRGRHPPPADPRLAAGAVRPSRSGP